MKTNRLFWTILCAAMILCIGVIAYLIAPGVSTQAKSRDLVGSWNVDIIVEAQNAQFPGFVTFFDDGNVITDEFPSLYETSGHGEWIRTRPNEVAYTFGFLIGSAEVNQQYIQGTVIGTAIYSPDTDEWDGPFSIRLVDQDGNELLSDTGTMQGTRITAGP